MCKSENIKKTLLETKNRRKQYICKTFEIKIINNKLSKDKSSKLNLLFLEAKRLYNYFLWDIENRINDTKIKTVSILNKKKQIENREINILSSQTKQWISKWIINSMIGLKRRKSNWWKIWRLKFKSKYNSIDLKQYWNTYKLLDDNYIQIQKLWKFKVKWLNQ